MSEIGPENEQTQSNFADKQSKNGDEQLQNMSVGDIDPAILLVRGKIKYTKEELLEIGKTSVSKRKPEFLDPAEVSVSILDPEKWNLERKKSDTPETSSKGSDNGENRRRPGDPRERIRKENDGIVLSPQRRSFNSGCFVPANKEPVRSLRPHSPLGGKNESTHIMAVRDIQSGTRRIGSGRIMRDSWGDVPDKDVGEADYGFGRGQSRPSEREEKFNERKSFGRDIDSNRDKEKDTRKNGRYGDRRKYSEYKEDEPEWFSSGPMSQNDTIELRGFDEPEKIKKKNTPNRVKRNKDFAKKKDTQPIAEEKEKEEASKEKSIKIPEVDSVKTSNDQSLPEKKPPSASEESEKQEKQVPSEPHQSDNSFNFEEFLKCDTIPGLLTNGISGDGNKTTSRFSQWFNKESPSKEVGESRRSSIQEDNHIIKDLLKDINESSSVPIAVHPPNDSNAYFAPISPAANTGSALAALTGSKPPQAAMGQSINLMDMLARSKQTPEAWKGAPPIGGKILSLDELEANIRPNADHGKNQHQKPDEEMALAFKKLLQQASHPVVQNMHKSQPMSLLEMLNHSQQQDEARLAAAQAAAATQQQQLLSALHGTPPQPPFTSELSLKLQQAQMQKQQMDILMQQSRELLNRPEAQAILQGLKRGEFTTQHLCQQLANPALQHRHRELLVTILKLNGHGYGPSPRVLSPAPLSHHMYQQQQQQQQQLRVSPLPPGAMHQRIPSPRELQVHTQNILQRALIKKKLEEQTENFRKKQEMQRGASPNTASGVAQGSNSKGVSSPTPLAFTPTSVLRKMTADKDEGKENKAVSDGGVKPPGRPLTGMRPQTQVTVGSQWNSAFPLKQAGRPIVKANNTYHSQTAEQLFAHMQQAHAQQQQRIYQQAVPNQQRKPMVGQQYPPQASQYGSTSQYPHVNPQAFSQTQTQLTAQQLRAQHQHRPSSNQQKPSQNTGNQNQPQPSNSSWQHFLNSAAQQPATRNQQSGSLSPSTSDQLARWFSPDLLERARGGELPSTANLARHALSLEEIERQAAPPVHN